MKLISSNDLNDKLDLFFAIVDADGNGNFSYDEIKDICKLSLPRIPESHERYQDFREETAEFYAKYIFRILEKDMDDEIPSEEFKEAILKGTQEQKEILAMFCFADAKTYSTHI